MNEELVTIVEKSGKEFQLPKEQLIYLEIKIVEIKNYLEIEMEAIESDIDKGNFINPWKKCPILHM